MSVIPSQSATKQRPMYYKLGETQAEVQAYTAEDNKNAAVALVKQAMYSIDIFTQDLDIKIYNHQEIEQSIFDLAKKHPNTRIRILVQDSKKAAQHGHCLIRLAQKLTSSVFIHNPSEEYKNERSSFMIVDKLGLLHRNSAIDNNYNGTVNFMSPRRAGKLTDLFNEIWDYSTPDIQIRHIFM